MWISMRKSVALLLVLVFLTASLIMAAKPVSATASVENSWTSKAPMHVARSDLGVAVVNGKIYAIGGNTESGYMPNSEGNDYKALGWIVPTNEEYDPATDAWTFKTPMPTPRYKFAIATYQNKVYCIGGITNWVSGEISYTGANEVYDPATDTWETKTSMPTATSAQANVVGGMIYLLGGGSNETLNQAFDPATDSWTMKEPVPSALGLHPPPNALSTLVSSFVDNKIYAISYSLASSQNWVYNPSTDGWSPVESSPSSFLEGSNWWSQAAGATTGVMAAKRIYVFFARYPYSTLLPTLAYTPSINAWAVAAAVPTYRQNFGVAVINDILYAIGGRTYNYPYPDDNYFTVTEQAVNEQYTPIGYGTPDPSYVPPDITPPEIAVLSPENKTYYATDITLNFTVNEPVSSMRYTLDGETLVEISGNITLTGLPYGSHNLTVYATDAADNTGVSETITFTVAEEPEPFPVAPVAAASIASVAFVATAILVYFKKRKH
jgi:hypothetical protein